MNSNRADDETIHFTDLNIIYNYPLTEPEKRGVKFLFVNNKIGRISKESVYIKGDHAKESIHNIGRRVKVLFYDIAFACLNQLIEAYNQSKYENKALPHIRDIYSIIKKETSQKENLNLFYNNVRNMLSQKIYFKFKKFSFSIILN